MHTLAWWPTVAVLLMATITDLRSRKIPNWLVLPFMLTGLGAAIYQHGWAGATHSLCGLALAAVMCGVAHFGRNGIEPHPQLVLSNPTARAIPYAPAIFIGTLLSFFAGSI
jgi:prepilin peptidase CpaA